MLKLFIIFIVITKCGANDILGCGGFVKSHVHLDFSKIEIGLYTKQGSLKEKTECAPTNGYYFLPLYEKGEYSLKVHPPPGWSFEPSEVDIVVDGVTDQCSTGQDVNFAFNGFGITGRVVTVGQKLGPSGLSVRLINEKGEIRDTITSNNGDFHFTPVIPGKYNIKASHPRWKLDPENVVVQVKEGNTALPIGALAVRGYDVSGSVTSFGSSVSGVYVLLYSKTDNLKYRVEGCTTALLQGVQEAPICYALTDSNGVFTFGLVPAENYDLVVLARPPGQVTVTYNVNPDRVSFQVRHDSIFIKNAFELTGFTVVGSVLKSTGGVGLQGVRVSMDGKPVGITDSTGRYTLPSLRPGTYTLHFEHEHCELDDSRLVVTNAGSVSGGQARVARWRVCGVVSPNEPTEQTAGATSRDVHIRLERAQGSQLQLTVHSEPTEGKWCTYLAPGIYTASVLVSEQERRDGLQYFPINQKISVGHGPVDGVLFSPLKAKLKGVVNCKEDASCDGLLVTLRPLSPDGSYMGQPIVTQCKGGQYEFDGVSPGSVEVSVPSERYCWAQARHNVAITSAAATLPPFQHTGYAVRFLTSHSVQVAYTSGKGSGVFTVEAGESQHCVASAVSYKFTPSGCHKFERAEYSCDLSRVTQTIRMNAVSHAVNVKVVSKEKVDDLIFHIKSVDGGSSVIGPIEPKLSDGNYMYEYTLYMAQGDVRLVSADSSQLLMHPKEAQSMIGNNDCQLDAVVFNAVRGLTLSGRIIPPVPGAIVKLTSVEGDISQTMSEDGRYSFGPLEADGQYTVQAEMESYVFSAPDSDGNIRAHRLAQINIEVVDSADGSPLQGALVSVSGGQYRRNMAASGDGRLKFPSLIPDDYYVKPLMKEYRFDPPHKIVSVLEGNIYNVTLKGVRVAWSAGGVLASLGGTGWGGALVAAAVVSNIHNSQRCSSEESLTEVASGAFRIRGLVPGCKYTLHLKESSTQEVTGLKLVNPPVEVQIKDGGGDIEGIRLIAVQPHQITDVNVLVYSPNIEHYKTLRLRLSLDTSPNSPIYSTKLDPIGYSQTMNPGLMHPMPRLPADNRTYVLQLESILSKATHTYSEPIVYFNSDGQFKHYTLEFSPKVKSSEQELSQTSLLVLPLLGLFSFLFLKRDRVMATLGTLGTELAARAQPKTGHQTHHRHGLDDNRLDQIVNTVNTTNKKVKSKKI